MPVLAIYVRRNNPKEGTLSTTEQAVAVDGDKLMQFVFRAVDEVGATLNAALVVMGDKLGLYKALAASDGLATFATTLVVRRRSASSAEWRR